MPRQHKSADFGVRFRLALNDSNLKRSTNIELGKVFKVSSTTAHNWRNGLKWPDMEHAVTISECLAVSVEWLLTGRGPMRVAREISREAQQLVTSFERLNPKRRAEILGYAAWIVGLAGDPAASDRLRKIAEELSPGVNP